MTSAERGAAVPSHLPWRVHGTSIYFANVAGGFSVHNCPDPENLAAFIHEACTSHAALSQRNEELLAVLNDADVVLEDWIGLLLANGMRHSVIDGEAVRKKIADIRQLLSKATPGSGTT